MLINMDNVDEFEWMTDFIKNNPAKYAHFLLESKKGAQFYTTIPFEIKDALLNYLAKPDDEVDKNKFYQTEIDELIVLLGGDSGYVEKKMLTYLTGDDASIMLALIKKNSLSPAQELYLAKHITPQSREHDMVIRFLFRFGKTESRLFVLQNFLFSGLHLLNRGDLEIERLAKDSSPQERDIIIKQIWERPELWENLAYFANSLGPTQFQKIINNNRATEQFICNFTHMVNEDNPGYTIEMLKLSDDEFLNFYKTVLRRGVRAKRIVEQFLDGEGSKISQNFIDHVFAHPTENMEALSVLIGKIDVPDSFINDCIKTMTNPNITLPYASRDAFMDILEKYPLNSRQADFILNAEMKSYSFSYVTKMAANKNLTGYDIKSLLLFLKNNRERTTLGDEAAVLGGLLEQHSELDVDAVTNAYSIWRRCSEALRYDIETSAKGLEFYQDMTVNLMREKNIPLELLLKINNTLPNKSVKLKKVLLSALVDKIDQGTLRFIDLGDKGDNAKLDRLLDKMLILADNKTRKFKRISKAFDVFSK